VLLVTSGPAMALPPVHYLFMTPLTLSGLSSTRHALTIWLNILWTRRVRRWRLWLNHVTHGLSTVETGWNHKSETLQAKCRSCQLFKPVVYDFLVGEEIERKAEEETYSDIAEAEAKSVATRREFWLEQFGRCIRCYACRQVCPGCYCPVCFAERLDPLWVGIRINPEENDMWQTIRSFHLAGRCIGCNECERVCPADIPLSLLNRKLEKEVKELFNFQAGLDPEEPPPFATFKKEEIMEFEK